MPHIFVAYVNKCLRVYTSETANQAMEVNIQNYSPGNSSVTHELLVINKGTLAWYGKLTWESAHACFLIILCYLIVWNITLIFMGRLSFYAIPLLIYEVINDITIIP